ncbi:hypothetical protein O6H91_22G017800 [Diphasiastrum complanatum]|uniref:Uncharacterized protein n=1 Tax=Diphasiastrum complanatum TaxID=34168 RepID=A0ACC2ADJ3_DIPCM|nr:hypothetical protein O6H91_22G017800 [Diphasiastrum complanatum]
MKPGPKPFRTVPSKQQARNDILKRRRARLHSPHPGTAKITNLQSCYQQIENPYPIPPHNNQRLSLLHGPSTKCCYNSQNNNPSRPRSRTNSSENSTRKSESLLMTLPEGDLYSERRGVERKMMNQPGRWSDSRTPRKAVLLAGGWSCTSATTRASKLYSAMAT